VELFSVWGAKVICGIGKLPPTTEDRSIVIHLKKKKNIERVEKFRYDKLGAFGDLKSKLKRFADDHIEALREADDPMLPEQLGDRPADNWRQLILIADLVDGGWPDKARDAALTLNDSAEDEEKLVHLLRDIRRVFNQKDKDTRVISSSELIQQLMDIEGSPWDNLSGKYKDKITTNKLAQMLAPLGIKSKKCRFGESTLQGYEFVIFDDAFVRYLPKDDGSNDDIEWDYAFGDPYAIYDGEPYEVQFSIISAN
jgi:putative DNA primase/helicase